MQEKNPNKKAPNPRSVLLHEQTFYVILKVERTNRLAVNVLPPVLRKGGDAYGTEYLGPDHDFLDPCRLKTEINRPSDQTLAVYS